MPVLKERHLLGECRQSVMELLKETYGYDGFRNLEIYDDLFKNRDTLCISQGQLVENVIREAEKAYKGGEQPDNILLTAPTGAGKSLLFQLPAIYLGKEYNLLTIVVSPLKALIVDQVEGLQDVGYERVAYASSDLSPEQKMEVYRAVREGEIDLFYLSPELLLSYDIRHFIGNRRIGMVVVDEAHTVTVSGALFGRIEAEPRLFVSPVCPDRHCRVEPQRRQRYGIRYHPLPANGALHTLCRYGQAQEYRF